MAQHYERLGVLDVEPVLAMIRTIMEQGATAAARRRSVTLLGQEVKVDGLRLMTFASHEPCCSNPECRRAAVFFALERHVDRHGNRQSDRYHLNLYGYDDQGNEILFTHDHTLARGLGGADALPNTTTMCAPCNFRKSKLEHEQLRQQRRRAGQDPHTGKPRRPMTTDVDSDSQNSRRLVQMFERQAILHRMSVAEYRAHCEAQGQMAPDLPRLSWTLRHQARLLQLTPAASLVFQTHVRQYHRAVASVLATPGLPPLPPPDRSPHAEWLGRLKIALSGYPWTPEVVEAHLRVGHQRFEAQPIPVLPQDVASVARRFRRRA